MDLSFLLELVDPIILGICLVAGYALKTAFTRFPNKYIPLAALCTGVVLAIIINMSGGITPQVILEGMISGLASTGMYELVRNLFDFDKRKTEC
ncbi:MAG: phage holin family protein [Lachnospiraceae bacterium]|nr:phage holin family protein [Lachnospiraceae bacterium]